MADWLKKSGWQKHVEGQSPVSDDAKALAAEVVELRGRVKRLEMEKEILKKATVYFASQNPRGSSSSRSDEGSSRCR